MRLSKRGEWWDLDTSGLGNAVRRARLPETRPEGHVARGDCLPSRWLLLQFYRELRSTDPLPVSTSRVSIVQKYRKWSLNSSRERQSGDQLSAACSTGTLPALEINWIYQKELRLLSFMNDPFCRSAPMRRSRIRTAESLDLVRSELWRICLRFPRRRSSSNTPRDRLPWFKRRRK